MLLKDLFEFLPKSKRPASYGLDDGTYPFYTSSNTIDSYVNEYDYNGEYLIIGDGGTANCKYVNNKFSVSDHNYILKPKNNTNAKLVYYFLKHDNYRILSAGFKGVGIKNVSKTYIENINFTKHTNETDELILNRFDSIDYLIEHEKRLLVNYNEFIKSRFIEMFGNLENNEKSWKLLPFRAFAKIDTNMIHDFSNIQDYPHIGIDSIAKNTGELMGYRTIKEDGIFSGKYLFTDKHIIYSKIRPNLNKVALPNFNGVCSADAYPILADNNICNRVFLAYVMRSDYFLKYILAFCGRACFPKVNKAQVEGFNCPMPPIELQNEFAELVKQIDKLKFISQNRIKSLEELLNKEMYEIFN